MIEVAPNLFVGNQADYDGQTWGADWAVVHAAKEPYHRAALGYTERAAPKDHPEYLWAYRERGEQAHGRLILNLVDAADPSYIPKSLIDEALTYLTLNLGAGLPTLVHCNQGKSRSPVIAMLHLAPTLPDQFEQAEDAMRLLYPPYEPAHGMREFARRNWPDYQARAA